MQAIKNPKFEVKINGTWRKVLDINYHTSEPTVGFEGPDGKGWMRNAEGKKEHFITKTTCYGWPLKDVELRMIE